jgi:hypothetical protein
MDFRQLFTHILNLKMLENGAYLKLVNEEWAIKIMINLLLNSGIDDKIAVDEQKKGDLINAQNIYSSYAKA